MSQGAEQVSVMEENKEGSHGTTRAGDAFHFDRALSSSSSSSSSSSLPLALCTLMPGFVPPLFQTGQRDEFTRSGKTLALVASPRDDSVAVYASANVRRPCCVTFAATEGACFFRPILGDLSRRPPSATSTLLGHMMLPPPNAALCVFSPIMPTIVC